MDADQCTRRIAQQVFKVYDPDYYEFEGIYWSIISQVILIVIMKSMYLTLSGSLILAIILDISNIGLINVTI